MENRMEEEHMTIQQAREATRVGGRYGCIGTEARKVKWHVIKADVPWSDQVIWSDGQEEPKGLVGFDAVLRTDWQPLGEEDKVGTPPYGAHWSPGAIKDLEVIEEEIGKLDATRDRKAIFQLTNILRHHLADKGRMKDQRVDYDLRNPRKTVEELKHLRRSFLSQLGIAGTIEGLLNILIREREGT
jgi:hypothetical protein